MKHTPKMHAAQAGRRRAPRPLSDPASELAFLSSENVLTYAGEWVAISNSTVVAHGPSLAKVRRQAQARLKGRKPTYFSVPTGAATY